MKKLFAIMFLGTFMLFGITTYASSLHKSTEACKIEVYKPSMVYINDSDTPDVSPQYGKAHFVHNEDDVVNGSAAVVSPNANAPPLNGRQGL